VGANKGKDVDAVVSSELLVSLFVPEGMNKLHDGAVIVRDLRIAKAGVFFPMPDQRALDQSFGSRHRAALGISEETDAVVVVVSEERGTISFIFNGNIASNLDGPKLKTMLEAIFSPKGRGKKPKPASRPATRRPEAPNAPEPIDSKREPPRSDAPTGLRISMPNEEPDDPPPSRRALRSISEIEPAPAPLRPRPVVDPNETGRLPPVLAPLGTEAAIEPREGRRPITLKSGKSPAADAPRDSASDEPERKP
jgi:diadenylate cyclase